MDAVTLILPFYQQPLILQRQLAELNQYPPAVQVIIVDDGSPVPAEPVIRAQASAALLAHLRLYRVLVDVPWARGTARNLGAVEASTAWILQTDIDHVLPASCVPALLAFAGDPATWYRFSRYRRGRADETRQKDALPRDCDFGLIAPHQDSYLIHRELFLRFPYDEDYNGCLGGGTPFLHRLLSHAPVALLPEPICLQVYTRHVIADASIQGLSRDTAEYTRRRREKERLGTTVPRDLVRLPWERVL